MLGISLFMRQTRYTCKYMFQQIYKNMKFITMPEISTQLLTLLQLAIQLVWQKTKLMGQPPTNL